VKVPESVAVMAVVVAVAVVVVAVTAVFVTVVVVVVVMEQALDWNDYVAVRGWELVSCRWA